MASIFLKNIEKTLVLANRESFQRAFDFGPDWTEIRFAMFYSFIDNTAGENTAAIAENTTRIDNEDRLFFGFRDSASVLTPGQPATRFLGACTYSGALTTNIAAGGSSVIHSGNGAAGGFCFVGIGDGLAEVSTAANSIATNAHKMSCPNVVPNSNYCGFYGIRLVVTNRGLPSQTITLYSSENNASGGTIVTSSTFTPTELRTLMNSFFTPTPGAPLPWNNGGAARALPDAIYIKMPFYFNRIRISCVRVARYA